MNTRQGKEMPRVGWPGPPLRPARCGNEPDTRGPLDLSARSHCGSARPRVIRMPLDWWESPPSVGCPLNRRPEAARAARRLTRNTLRDWGLIALVEDAETIVGELVANAVMHAMTPASGRRPTGQDLALRLHRRTGEVICAVLDPSDATPVLKGPGCAGESGRGLQIVDALSDVWGWSPVAGRGKAVWAILFCE
jgi:Histidine kinase-like ATPase domain